MKTCNTCQETKALEEFHLSNQNSQGRRTNCKKCRVKICHDDYLKRRDKHIETVNKYRKTEHGKAIRKKAWDKQARMKPEQRKARDAVNNAIKSGKLKKGTKCEICDGTGLLHGHHTDYHLPLDVNWLCARCHKNHHLWLEQQSSSS